MAARGSLHGTWGPRLLSVLRVVAVLLLLPHGAQKLIGAPVGPPPRHPSVPCINKGIGLRRVMKDGRQRLSFSYDLKRLAAAMRPKRGYEVSVHPDGNEVKITRTFDGVKYNIIFGGGDSLSFTVNSGEERCATPDRLIKRRVYRMIGDLPLEARQKAELEGHVAVLSRSWMPSETYHPPDPNPPG